MDSPCVPGFVSLALLHVELQYFLYYISLSPCLYISIYFRSYLLNALSVRALSLTVVSSTSTLTLTLVTSPYYTIWRSHKSLIVITHTTLVLGTCACMGSSFYIFPLLWPCLACLVRAPLLERSTRDAQSFCTCHVLLALLSQPGGHLVYIDCSCVSESSVSDSQLQVCIS